MSQAQQPLKLGDPGLVLVPVAIEAVRSVVILGQSISPSGTEDWDGRRGRGHTGSIPALHDLPLGAHKLLSILGKSLLIRHKGYLPMFGKIIEGPNANVTFGPHRYMLYRSSLIKNQWQEKKYMSLKTVKTVGTSRNLMPSEYQVTQIRKQRQLTAREISV